MTESHTERMDETELRQRVQSLENEKKMFFEVAYKAYTRLAEVADQAGDEETGKRVRSAIEDLGRVIGRTESRERPR